MFFHMVAFQQNWVNFGPFYTWFNKDNDSNLFSYNTKNLTW